MLCKDEHPLSRHIIQCDLILIIFGFKQTYYTIFCNRLIMIKDKNLSCDKWTLQRIKQFSRKTGLSNIVQFDSLILLRQRVGTGSGRTTPLLAVEGPELIDDPVIRFVDILIDREQSWVTSFHLAVNPLVITTCRWNMLEGSEIAIFRPLFLFTITKMSMISD